MAKSTNPFRFRLLDDPRVGDAGQALKLSFDHIRKRSPNPTYEPGPVRVVGLPGLPAPSESGTITVRRSY